MNAGWWKQEIYRTGSDFSQSSNQMSRIQRLIMAKMVQAG
jgi:hypothetical protein